MGATLTVTRLLDLSTYALSCGPGPDCTSTPESVIKKFTSKNYAHMMATDYANHDRFDILNNQSPPTQGPLRILYVGLRVDIRGFLG